MVHINPLVALIIGLTSIFAPRPPAAFIWAAMETSGPPDGRFGAVETYDAPDAAYQMGAGWTRIPFLWANIQPNNDQEWSPPLSDAALAREIAGGRQPVGLVITTPGWATDAGIGPGVPNGLHTSHNDPANAWANFLRRLATTYAGRIDHWIIWNEPDVWDAAHPGYTWGGSVEDFLQLQRVAYATIKESNPNAQVILSATSYWWDAAYGRELYFRRYLDALVQDGGALGNNYYCDVVALHVYFQPDFVYSITALYHQLMREHGFDKPIWIVETNAAPSLDPQMPAPNARFAISLEEQAAYIVQAFAMAIAGGATRIGVFKMIDTPTDRAANPEPFGLVRANGSRRPAFNTYRVAATYMAGFQGGELEQRPDASIVRIPRANGKTTVLWTRTPAPATVEISAQAESAALVDMWGNRRSLSASNGIYTVSLPGATCTHGPPCIIGGAPYLIVEGSVEAAPPPAQPSSQEEQPGSQAQPSEDQQETSAPTATATDLPEYSVNLRPVEIKGARDVWHKRGLPGYQIELFVEPPSHLYRLTVVGDKVTEAQRSLQPLGLTLEDLNRVQGQAPVSTTMTTLYNRRTLVPYTVEGLFERVNQYHQDRPTSPACDTDVTVRLNGDWAFPRLIVEQWTEDCQDDGLPSWMSVLAFATLTPTPSPAPTPTQTATPAPSATPSATALTTSTRPPSHSSTATASPTPPSSPTATDGWDFSIWMVVLAGLAVGGAFLIRWNGKNPKNAA
jgi:hypothetical protein